MRYKKPTRVCRAIIQVELDKRNYDDVTATMIYDAVKSSKIINAVTLSMEAMHYRDREDDTRVSLTGNLDKAGERTDAYGGGGYKGSFVDKCQV